MRLVVTAALLLTVSTGSALGQTTMEAGRALVYGSLGWQFDIGGSLNSSGIGVVNGLRAEVDSNTWGERYDLALVFKVGGVYSITDRSQVYAQIDWEQAEADPTEVGLIGGRPLTGDFSDYQGWGIQVGYRRTFPLANTPVLPFVSGSFGFARVQDITVTLTSDIGFRADDVPFYDDSFVGSWRAGGGFYWDIKPQFGLQGTMEFKYAGVLSDQSGIGTVGFERINDTGNRWTLPMSVGVYYKF